MTTKSEFRRKAERMKVRCELDTLRKPFPEIHSTWDTCWMRPYALDIVPAGTKVALYGVWGHQDRCVREKQRIFAKNSEFMRPHTPEERPFGNRFFYEKGYFEKRAVPDRTTPCEDIVITLEEDCRVIDALALVENATIEFLAENECSEMRHYVIEGVVLENGTLEFRYGT